MTDIKILLGGMLVLAASLGIGRFAYTPLLPLMQAESGFGADTAGWLATANYLGYLVGAMWAGSVRGDAARRRLLAAGLVGCAISVTLMPLADGPVAWAALRLAAGLAGALVFIFATAMVLPPLAASGRGGLAGWHFGGIGVGIVISGTVGAMVPSSTAGWLILGTLAAVIGAAGWMALGRLPAGPAGNAAAASHPPSSAYPMAFLAAAYFCEGTGYIVTGTFLMAKLRALPALAGWDNMAWVAVGLAALPSAALWSTLAARLGFLPALVAAHLVQAVGIALPALSSHPAAVLVGAFLFGVTFLGIVGLALGFARTIATGAAARIMGWLTAIYGVGQMAAPVAAGWLAERTQSWDPPLLTAAVVVAAGAVILLAGARRRRTIA